MNFKRIIIPLLLIFFFASMVALGAPTYGNVGPTTEFEYDIKIIDEIVAEGNTADGWETTIFFTDPTADRTITIPDADATVGIVTGIVPPDHGGTGIANNVANTITFTGNWSLGLTLTANTSITLPTAGIVVSDNNACTDVEGTKLSIAGGVLNCTETDSVVGAVTGIVLSDGGGNITASAVADTLVLYIDGATNIPSGEAGFTYVKGTDTLSVVNIVCTSVTGALTGNATTCTTASAGDAAVDFFGAGVDAVTDTTTCTDIEGTGLAIAGGTLNMTVPVEHIDSDMYVDGSIDHEHLAPDVIHGWAADTLAGADEFIFYDENGADLNKITWTNLMGSISSLSGMSGAIATPTNISMTGELDMTGASAIIDLNPAATGIQQVINITSTATIVATSEWDGIKIDGDALDPLTGGATFIHGFHADFSGVLSADGDDAVVGGTYILLPTGDTAFSFAHYHIITEMTVAGTQTGYCSSGAALDLSATATYRGTWIDWDLITRDANAPVLEGMRVELPADYTNFGANFAAYFTGGGENVKICDGTYALNVNGTVTIDGTVILGANNITLTGYIGRDADNFLGFAVDDSLAIEIGGVAHAIVSITDGAGDNDKLVTQGYVDDAVIAGGANVALSNLAGVAINTTLLSDGASVDDLGTVDNEWLNLYLGVYGTVYFGAGQTESIAETAVNELTITSTNVIVAGILAANSYNNKLSAFAATTSAELAGVISNETGTGLIVYGTSPTFTDHIILNKCNDTAALAPYFDFQRAQADSPEDDVVDEDYLGIINFYGYHTDGYDLGTTIRAIVDADPGNADMPSRLEFLTSPDASATPLIRMVIDDAGEMFLPYGQINFPDAQNASADTNTLDDYEEGDWSATIVCGTSGTVTLDGAYTTGAYTKIGRMVTVTGFFLVDSVSSPVGNLTLNTLPFTCGNANKFDSAISVYAAGLENTAVTAIIGRIAKNTTGILLYRFEAGAATNIAADVKAGSYFVITATYFTD